MYQQQYYQGQGQYPSGPPPPPPVREFCSFDGLCTGNAWRECGGGGQSSLTRSIIGIFNAFVNKESNGKVIKAHWGGGGEPYGVRYRFSSVLRIRIRDPVPFWPLDPGSGIGFFRIPDLGSRIPNPYFWELIDNFLGKKFYNSLKICPNCFSSAHQN